MKGEKDLDKVLLKKIELKNFCGIEYGSHEFADLDYICGAFGSGKSSFYNAYKWVFGLNTDFEPKFDGKKVKGIITEVSADVERNGIVSSFRRVAKQVWKSDDEDVTVEKFDKYKYEYYCDGIELKAKSYAEKVLNYLQLQNETELNAALDFQFFNSTNEPKWNNEKRRNFLFSLYNISEKTEEMCKDFGLIYEDLYKKGISQEDLRKSLKRQRDEFARQLVAAKAQADMLTANLAQLNAIDFTEARANKTALWAKLEDLQKQTTNEQIDKQINQLASEQAKYREEMAKAQQEYFQCSTEYNKAISAKENEIATISNSIKLAEQLIKEWESQIEDWQIAKDDLEATTFDENTTKCPVCNRKLSEAACKKKKETFEETKKAKIDNLAKFIATAENAKAEKAKDIATYTAEKQKAETELDKFKADKPFEPDFSKVEEKIKVISDKINALRNGNSDTNNEAEIASAKAKLSEVEAVLAKEADIAKCTEEINKLKATSIDLANQDRTLAQKQAQLTEFSEKEIRLADNLINSDFGNVKFSFFDELGGGSDRGVRKTCVATMNGIRYENLSGGQQILCDFLVSAALRKKLGWKLPLWADEVCRISNNREVIDTVFEFENYAWQSICLITQDEKKLPVVLLKGGN